VRLTAPLLLSALLALVLPTAARARSLRPRFEPTDLELEDPGVIELDLQVGFIQSRGPYRLVLPDVELDIGVFSNFELDLDWTYAIEQPFDHSAADNVWISGKVGLYDHHFVAGGSAGSVAVGVQLGPRLGAATGARGGGFEGLALLAIEYWRLHLVLNGGVLVDSPLDAGYRPLAIESGFDATFDLTRNGRFAATAALAAVYFASIDPHQIVIAAGASWSPRDSFSLSLSGLVGFLAGGDRYGFLLGYSQKLVAAPARR
jgi:hypothetical protein